MLNSSLSCPRLSCLSPKCEALLKSLNKGSQSARQLPGIRVSPCRIIFVKSFLRSLDVYISWFIYSSKYLLNTWLCSVAVVGCLTVNTVATVCHYESIVWYRIQTNNQAGAHTVPVWCGHCKHKTLRCAESGLLMAGIGKASRTKWYQSPALKMIGLIKSKEGVERRGRSFRAERITKAQEGWGSKINLACWCREHLCLCVYRVGMWLKERKGGIQSQMAHVSN